MLLYGHLDYVSFGINVSLHYVVHRVDGGNVFLYKNGTCITNFRVS